MRKLALLTVVVVSALLLLGTYTAQAGDNRCPALKKGITYYKHKTWVTQDKFNAPRTKASNQKVIGCAYARWVRNAWKWRAKHERNTLEWRWELWLPRVWQNICHCETRLNWRHSNSSFQGAFGFATSSWDDYKLKGYPHEAWQASPWQQYQVALAIHNRWGFSGWGCA